jgi:chemotaxis protein CheD
MSTQEVGFVEHLAGNRYFDRKFSAEAVKVLPGEYFVTSTNLLMVTVLGSCVSACIRDRELGIGGMNHFMLADAGDVGMVSPSARYGTYAMEILINHLLKLGARKSNLEAKVFGGGRVMATLASSQIGERNAKFVMKFLDTEGIRVAASDLLDVYPRKVYFFPRNGKVLMKKLARMHNDTLIRRESEYAARLIEAPLAGEIELF